MFEVCAGGRRLESLALLVASADSLAENVCREPLSVADELAGFLRLSEEGKPVEDIAAAFGVTPLVVKRRLKLAAVSPRLMALFREEKIGLDCLMALASVEDHQKQEQPGPAFSPGTAIQRRCAGCCPRARSNPTATRWPSTST